MRLKRSCAKAEVQAEELGGSSPVHAEAAEHDFRIIATVMRFFAPAYRLTGVLPNSTSMCSGTWACRAGDT